MASSSQHPPPFARESSAELRENTAAVSAAAEPTSKKYDLLRVIQVLTHLRMKGLEREGVHIPLLVVVTDAVGRESCPPELLESIGGSRLWRDFCGTPYCIPPVPVTLHLRGCRAGETPSYAIEYNNKKKQLVDKSDFPPQVDTAFNKLFHHHKSDHRKHAQEPPILLRLRSHSRLDLADVYFRWEKGPEHEEETSQIEYQLLDRQVVKIIKWDELEAEMDSARRAMDQLNVKSDILFRTRSPHVHRISTVYKFDASPSESSPTIIVYDGHKREIPEWKYIEREIDLARMKLDARTRVGYPIVLHIRERFAPDLIRVDLPDHVTEFPVECVASVIAGLLDPEGPPVLVSALCADDKNSTALVGDLTQMLQKFAVVQKNCAETCLCLIREIKNQELVKRRELVNLPLPRRRSATRMRADIELARIKTKVFQDLERYMLCGGITMFSHNPQLHYATQVSTILRKYTKQLLTEGELFPPTEEDSDELQISASIPAEAKEAQLPDQTTVLKLLKQLDEIEQWSTTLVTELHDYTKSFVLSVLHKHMSYFPVLFQRYRDAMTEALRDASVICRAFINHTVPDEKALALGLEIGGGSLKSLSQLRRRYKSVELKFTSRLHTVFSEAVDTHMKTNVGANTRFSAYATLVLSSSALTKREELRASINLLTESIKEVMSCGEY